MQQIKTRPWALAAAICLAVGLALAVSACGSSSSSSSGSSQGGSTESSGSGELIGDWEGTGSLEGSGEIPVFYPSGGLLYNTLWMEGVKEVLEEHGYKPRFFSDEYSQPEQDQQVQQYLATNPDPAGSIVYPPVPLAAENTVRQLGKLAPIIQSTTGPRIEPAAFAASNQVQGGEYMGQSYLALQKHVEEEGEKLEPNILFFNVPKSLHAGEERKEGFLKVLEKEGIKVNEVGENEGVTGEQSGYEAANEVLAKYQGKFDVVWAITLSGAAGIAKVLKENGYHPGKDVYIVSGGECTEYLSGVESGEIWSTVAQPPGPEGRIVARTLFQIISAGGFKPGSTILKPTPDEPPLANEAPTEHVQVPQKAIIGPEEARSLELWGQGPSEICAN